MKIVPLGVQHFSLLDFFSRKYPISYRLVDFSIIDHLLDCLQMPDKDSIGLPLVYAAYRITSSSNRQIKITFIDRSI